ncbi:MAG TPA: 6-oxocyclohex-1-ene-1-carbonyl-CoA hydratase, partial [Rhodospirillales bacterium]|nr:6-oxocyclohex-1-ene-1-carbonyl-CoA hydratase [Rhodospirillales bacterium]
MSHTDQIIAETKPDTLNDHNLVAEDATVVDGILYDKRPAKRADGSVAEGLFNVWITLDNPKQYNSYTTDMVKGAILAFRRASVDRSVNAVVFTGTGDK